MLLALVMSYASLFIIKKPDGTPIRTLDSLVPSFDFTPVTNAINAALVLLEGSGEEAKSGIVVSGITGQITTATTTYKWRDENGNLHYTDSPPAGMASETVTLDAPTVMNLYPQQTGQTEETAAIGTEENPIVLPGRLGEMQDSLQQAREVSDQFQQKLNEQQQVLEFL